jgi:hypothetical protein
MHEQLLLGSLVGSEHVVQEVEAAQVKHLTGHAEQILPLVKNPFVQAQLLFKELRAAPFKQVKHLVVVIASQVAQRGP